MPAFVAQLAALDADARARGGRWQALDVETRRALLDAAFTKAGVKALPQRPTGQHVVADLMAFYFRSTEANDYCYSALIQREVCRPIAITTKRPAPLAGNDDQPLIVRLSNDEMAEFPALTVVSEDHHAGS